jgi:hypothetical protein
MPKNQVPSPIIRAFRNINARSKSK